MCFKYLFGFGLGSVRILHSFDFYQILMTDSKSGRMGTFQILNKKFTKKFIIVDIV